MNVLTLPARAEVAVEWLQPDGAAEWDAYAAAHPDGTFFHRAAWRDILGRLPGFHPHYLLVRRRGCIAGVLPLVRVRSPWFGEALVSLPFCVEAGVLASDEASEDALLANASALASFQSVDWLELRHRRAHRPDWPSNSDTYAVFRRALAASAADAFAAIPRKQRAMIRKANSFGLTSVEESSLEHFWPIYATSVRNLGTPVFPRRYFADLLTTFGNAARVTTVFDGDTPVASVLSFVHEGCVLPYYGGGLPQARRLNAFDFLYWEVMRRAVDEGLHTFDFGRSKRGTGAFDFKRHWGFEPSPLCYEYRLLRARAVPRRNPGNPRFRLAVSLWKHLPLAVANRLGPLVSPYLA